MMAKRLRLIGHEIPVHYIAPNVSGNISVQRYDNHSTSSTHIADRYRPRNIFNTRVVYNQALVYVLEPNTGVPSPLTPAVL